MLLQPRGPLSTEFSEEAEPGGECESAGAGAGNAAGRGPGAVRQPAASDGLRPAPAQAPRHARLCFRTLT